MLKLEGKNAELMMELLKTWQLTDANGVEGDSLTLSIFSEDVDGIPQKGEKYKVYLCDVYRDEFQISKRSLSLSPRELRLILSVAPFSVTDDTEYRAKRSASWNDATIYEIVTDCVAPHGFSVFVHPKLQNIKIEHIDRTDESAPAFIRRLAKQFDAISKIVEDRYVIAPKGETRSASGKNIETITLSHLDVKKGVPSEFVNVDIDLDGRDEFNGVRASYLTTESGDRIEVMVGERPFKLIGRDYQSEAEAEQACNTELRRIQREGRKLTITAPPNPLAFAEGIAVLDASFPRAFQGECSIDSVTFTGRGRQPSSMTIQATALGSE